MILLKWKNKILKTFSEKEIRIESQLWDKIFSKFNNYLSKLIDSLII